MKRKKFKGIITAIMAILMCFALFGCGGSGDESGSADEPTNPNKIGDYEVTIDSCEVTADWEGKNAVKVVFTFKNNSEEATDFMTSMMTKVYQDGVELETTFTDDYDDNQNLSIKQGKSIVVSDVYLLNDTENPIEIEVTEFLGTTDEKVTKTLNIK